MTAQIANCINDVLKPKGVGVVVEGVHHCMTTRGIHKPGVAMMTSCLLGDFRSDPRTRAEFLNIIRRAPLSWMPWDQARRDRGPAGEGD